jgi:hypothetical protein
MNKLCSVATNANESAIGTLDQKDARMPKPIHVLFVGPLDFGSMVHDALLCGPNSRLSIAPDYRELWVIPKQESIQVVVLHSTLSSFELDDATRFIRQRWPHTRILVIRSSEGSLDDALYDDRVAPTVEPEVLLTTIERLTGRWREWRSRDVEL